MTREDILTAELADARDDIKLLARLLQQYEGCNDCPECYASPKMLADTTNHYGPTGKLRAQTVIPKGWKIEHAEWCLVHLALKRAEQHRSKE